MNPRLDLDFIQRCCEGFEDEKFQNAEKQRTRINKWNNENREKCRQSNRNYYKSEKGKERQRKRRRSMIESLKTLSFEQKMLVKNFYLNTPAGYEVDHIIPLSKGGGHYIDNLQYLTKQQNSSKGIGQSYNKDYEVCAYVLF